MSGSSKSWNSNFLLSGFVFWLVVAAFAAYFLHPIRQSLKFGIDLVGGTYITLKVETDKAIEHELRNHTKRLIAALKTDKLAVPVSHKVVGKKSTMTFEDAITASAAMHSLLSNGVGMRVNQDGSVVSVAMSKDAMAQLAGWALESNIEVLRSRLNKLGVEEIKITAQGVDSIVVELPDVDNPTRAKEMIGTPAMLEFKVVEGRGSSHEDILEEYGGEVPEGMMIIPNGDSHGGREFLLVPDLAEVTGRHLLDALPASDDANNRLAVSFKFSPEGGEKFYELTSDNINRPLAAILDNQAISVANINEPIRSNVQISGNFTIEQAKELATLLKSGAFVAPVTFSEERRVGPSLGAASIKSGLMSCLIGLGLLLLFSVYYYKICGIFAFIALLFNLLLVLFALSVTGATLTLPGIAGMVLTVGMAIDASVLIYERIKELLKEGKSVQQAVSLGFSNAMVVILDGNITTFIVGVVLFKFGTGPIQGFAVTMMIGIVSTLITGLFFLRSLINFALDRQKVQKLSI
jgi:preprotein translocase subunit SecD